MMNWIPPSELGIPEERIYILRRRPLFLRVELPLAERLEASARKRAISPTELIDRIIKQHLDGDDWRRSDM